MVTVAVNFAPEARSIRLDPPADGASWHCLAGSHPDDVDATATDPGTLRLRPYEGVVRR